MTYEITQIKEWFGKHLGLRTEGTGLMLRVVDPVPDGYYVIPIGVSLTPTVVRINNDKIIILGDAIMGLPAPAGSGEGAAVARLVEGAKGALALLLAGDVGGAKDALRAGLDALDAGRRGEGRRMISLEEVDGESVADRINRLAQESLDLSILCAERQAEIDRLRAALAAATAERDAYAREALACLSGLVETPEKGYIADGGPALFLRDARRFRAVFKEVERERDEARRIINRFSVCFGRQRKLGCTIWSLLLAEREGGYRYGRKDGSFWIFDRWDDVLAAVRLAAGLSDGKEGDRGNPS